MSAPEKIWACMEGPMVGLFVSGGNTGGWPEYIRADIATSEADALRAALEAAANALDEAFRALGDAGEAMGDEGPSRHEARAFLASETARKAAMKEDAA